MKKMGKLWEGFGRMVAEQRGNKGEIPMSICKESEQLYREGAL